MPPKTSPLTFELDKELIERLSEFKERTGSSSVSAVIRAALEEFDLDELKASAPERAQVSVRLPSELRDELMTVAKTNEVPAGKIVRESVLSFLGRDGLPTRNAVTDSPQTPHHPLPAKDNRHGDDANPWQI